MARVELIHEFVAHSSKVNCLRFGPEYYQIVATGGDDNRVNLWRIANAGNYWSLSGNTSPVHCLCFDPQETYIVSGSKGGSLKVYDLEVGKIARSLSGHMSAVTCINYHPYGEFLVSGSADTNFKIWDLRTKKCVLTYKGHSSELTEARFTPDGQWCATSGKDGALTIWDLKRKEVIHTFCLEGPAASILHFDFNPSELLVAAATSERLVRIWDSETFEVVGSSTPEPQSVRAMAFDPSGDTLYTATDKSLRILDGRSGQLRRQVESIWDRITAISTTGLEDQMLAGAFQNNFVSLYTIDLSVASQKRPQTSLSLNHHALEKGEGRARAVSAPTPSLEGNTLRDAVREERASAEAKRGRRRERTQRDLTAFQGKGGEEDKKSERKGGGWWVAVGQENDGKAALTGQARNGQGSLEADRPLPLADWARRAESAAAGRPRTAETKEEMKVEGQNQKSCSPSPSRIAGGGAEALVRPFSSAAEESRVGGLDQQQAATTNALLKGHAEGSDIGEQRNDCAEGTAKPGADTSTAIADAEVVSRTQVHHTTLITTLSIRLTQLQVLSNLWATGEVMGAFRYLRELYDVQPEDNSRLTVLADFLRVIDLDSEGVTLEASNLLLPILVSLLSIKFENHVLVGLKVVEHLLFLFGPYVRGVRGQVGIGVDLAGEARRAKCDVFHEGMRQLEVVVHSAVGDKERVRRLQRKVEEYLNDIR